MDETIELTRQFRSDLGQSTVEHPEPPFQVRNTQLIYLMCEFERDVLRALLPPELFGREDYGAIQGMIAMPVRITMAGAPFAFGALWAWQGSYDAVLISCAVMALCLIMALCSLGAFVLNLALAKEP